MENKEELYYYHNDINGAPIRLTDQQGKIVWNAHYSIMGKIDRLKVKEVHNPIRMQGQYEDSETGLYYNRHRYFDPVICAYISQDPLGLLAGESVYCYTINTFMWCDALGLSCQSTGNKGNKYEYNTVENPGPLSNVQGNPASNFAGGKYNMEVLKEDRVYYRAGDANKPLGQWFTSQPAESSIKVRGDLAVKPQWIDPKTGSLTGISPINTNYAIKIPAGTTVYTGPVGYQGGAYLGGQNVMQTFIQEPWKLKGLDVISSSPLK